MYDHILVPIAFDEQTDEKTTRALEIARALSAPQAKITLLHVMEAVPGYVINYLPTEFSQEAHKAIESELTKLAETVPNGQALLISGHSGRSILDWADAHKPDLIVIASHRPGMQDLLLGSTATQVVRHAQCAVHVLR
ncbi:MAG: universal stress protein [Pelagimonas sp.]|jgi:nucleotide-binding universal stress UspA family protein|nr:universal stress protein [Pelagimonas sp.]